MSSPKTASPSPTDDLGLYEPSSPGTSPAASISHVHTPAEPVEEDSEDAQKRYQKLTSMLRRSLLFSSLLSERISQQQEETTAASSAAPTSDTVGESPKRNRNSKKRAREEDNSAAQVAKRVKGEDGAPVARDSIDFAQPKLVTGAKMRDYQLAGVQWMTGLYLNSLNGILADEMGLGKTLQTIGFICHLLENKVSKPFLVVCPLSVMHNWEAEFHKFAPAVNVCCYHGTPDDRAELRRTVLKEQTDDESPVASSSKGKRKSTSTAGRKSSKASSNARRKTTAATAPEDSETVTGPETDEDMTARVKKCFPVVVTTYEMVTRDSKYLSAYDWGYIIVDEGHRLKNMNCKLIQELRKYPSANRMIITGTPLHNNLAELWSLMNWILPELFNDLETFQKFFDFDTMGDALGTEQKTHVVSTLHAILAPFLLRRLKTDVETSLPPKKEYVLYAPLTLKQKELYQATLDGALRHWLLTSKGVQTQPAPTQPADVDAPRRMRKRKTVDYNLESDDDEYIEKLQRGERPQNGDEARAEVQETLRNNTVRQVNNMHLQNVTMQLRKASCHPFLLDWPVDPLTRQYILNDELVSSSGKMMMLERLLDELFHRDHKVLLFSQFTTMLDIVEDWAVEYKKWKICRIDGSTSPEDRRSQMNLFNSSEGEPRLFLLSTRAGGLGINLVAADTVIFFDNDWNPQMDLQAQDRAHRIGQTRPVLVFRLVTQNTIENRIMNRAGEKRKLEALVIAKGKFRTPGRQAAAVDQAASLLKLEDDQIEVASKGDVLITDHALEQLLDRTPAAFERAKGWTYDTADSGAAFEVIETVLDEGSDALANMLSEEPALA